MTALKPVLRFGILSWLFSIGGAIADDADGRAVDIQEGFTPSGWIGDGEYARKYIEFSGADTTSPHFPPTFIKVTYTFGRLHWAGIYWQNQPDNWGDRPGINLSGKKVAKLSFWARGKSTRSIFQAPISAV